MKTYKNWRKELCDALVRYRVVDKLLKDRMKDGDVYICEKHFTQKDIECTSNCIFYILYVP